MDLGAYNIHDGYNILVKQQKLESDSPSVLCWHNNCLSKVGIFAWEIIQGRVLTIDRFKKM